MLKNPHIRRPVALLLMILGAAIIYLTPETKVGTLLLALGAAVEVAGIALKRKS